MNREYMIGEKVIFKCMVDGNIFNVICKVCVPEQETNYGIWIDNPALGYKQNVSTCNVKPYEINHNIYHAMLKRINSSNCDLSKDLKDIINNLS